MYQIGTIIYNRFIKFIVNYLNKNSSLEKYILKYLSNSLEKVYLKIPTQFFIFIFYAKVKCTTDFFVLQ